MRKKAIPSPVKAEQPSIPTPVALNVEARGRISNQAAGPRPSQSDISVKWMGFEAALFAETLHGDDEGYVRFLTTSAKGTYDHYVPIADAGRTARTYAGASDVYVSLGAYRYPRGAMAGIRAIQVDLDFYKVSTWKNAKPQDVHAAVLEVLAQARIPVPNLAAATGRGLQIVWLVPPVKLRARPKATAAMRSLITLLAPFGADPACTDLARVFRLPGTVNSKNGQVARLLSCDSRRCDFDALCRAILGPRKAQKRSRESAARNMRAENSSLVCRRLADLGRIIFGRWRGKTPEGLRNTVAHLAAVHLVQLPGDPFENTRLWCAKWIDRLEDREIKRIVNSALKNKARKGGYRYSGRRIGELLSITADEVRRFQLATIYAKTDTPEEIKRRRRARDADAKRRKRRSAGARPQEDSARRREPWLDLGISRTTYYRKQRQNGSETISAPLHTVSSETTPLGGTPVSRVQIEGSGTVLGNLERASASDLRR